VKAQHEHIVGRPAHASKTQSCAPFLYRAAQERVILGDLPQPGAFRMQLRKNIETLGGLPHARALRIQICEYAQNAAAARGPAGKCVHVQ